MGPDGAFRQAYDTTEVDASLLQVPQTGFCDYDDPGCWPRWPASRPSLLDDDGFVHRYRTSADRDGLPGGEGAFLICTFWLVEQYAHTGRLDEAEALMTRLVGTAGDLGLLAEEYDARLGQPARQLPPGVQPPRPDPRRRRHRAQPRGAGARQGQPLRHLGAVLADGLTQDADAGRPTPRARGGPAVERGLSRAA